MNMILSIASGKGGTGKTTVAVNMALSLKNVQLLDCDVEEPNAHILLQPEIAEVTPVYKQVPQIREERCSYCKRCSTFCAYNAIFVAAETIMVFPELCHSCGGCSLVCPEDAIFETQNQVGNIKKGTVKGIELVYGELKVGEPMPIPLIKEVKRRINSEKTVLIDAPPGTACPFVASVYPSDYCLLVTEPTPFGLHDVQIAVDVLDTLSVPYGIVINRAGIGDRRVYEYCDNKEIPILLEIPYHRTIAHLYSQGIPFVKNMPEWREHFKQLYHKIKRYSH
jgi:MinD superfamily P-loop ATPase